MGTFVLAQYKIRFSGVLGKQFIKCVNKIPDMTSLEASCIITDHDR